ncbi:MAG TPA: PhoH family protein, partial [Chromatiales bacterium]|nr:PhoH family protein [Chromatiales bacterium]HEX22694.1 PhoH family protein [Chromatiales bacterium]
SGLRHVIEVLKDIDGISFTFFQAKDVVRHPLVQRIVTAYDEYESVQEKAQQGAQKESLPGNNGERKSS